MTSPLHLLALAALVLAGCGPEAPADTSPSDMPASDVAEAPSAPAGYEAVIAGPDRVSVLNSDGSEAVATFGMGQAEAVAALAPALGPPAAESENPDCPSGPTTVVDWENGLSLAFVDGALAGWRAMGDDERLQTADGVQLGTPRDILVSIPSVALTEGSTLGDEFGIDGPDGYVGGFLDGPGDGALVMELFGGVTCYAS